MKHRYIALRSAIVWISLTDNVQKNVPVSKNANQHVHLSVVSVYKIILSVTLCIAHQQTPLLFRYFILSLNAEIKTTTMHA